MFGCCVLISCWWDRDWRFGFWFWRWGLFCWVDLEDCWWRSWFWVCSWVNGLDCRLVVWCWVFWFGCRDGLFWCCWWWVMMNVCGSWLVCVCSLVGVGCWVERVGWCLLCGVLMCRNLCSCWWWLVCVELCFLLVWGRVLCSLLLCVWRVM